MAGLLLLALLAGCGDADEAARAGVEAPLDLDAPPRCPSDLDDALDAFAVEVVSFTPGAGAGFGQELMPDIVLGPPRGVGDDNGGVDVVALGQGGEIVLRLGAWAVDCDGPDLLIFENAFVFGDITYSELGEVSVSADGRNWVSFPCDPDSPWPHEGCAGVGPVYSGELAPELSPRDPSVSGGDAFDLADVGLPRVRFVKIRDLGRASGFSGPPSRGFDLDAVAIPEGHAEALP